MSAAILNVLNSMLESFVVYPKVTTEPVPAGEIARVELRPLGSDLAFSPILDIPVDLNAISKSLSFTTPDISDTEIQSPTIGSLFSGALGRVTGEVPVPVAAARVRIEVKWIVQRRGFVTSPPDPATTGTSKPSRSGRSTARLLKEPDVGISDAALATDPSLFDVELTAAYTYIDLVEGQDFIALEGLRLPTASFLFTLPARRLREGEELRPVTRYVAADIRLSTLGITTDWFRLPHASILLMPIGLPVVLACFQYPLYKGASIVFIPKDSPKQLDKLQDVLDMLAAIGRVIDKVATLAGSIPILKLPSRIRHLVRALNDSTHRHLDRDDANSNLAGIHLIKREYEVGVNTGVGTVSVGFGDSSERDKRANRVFSSLMIIGPRGTKATFFKAQSLSGSKKLIMTTGPEAFCFIPDLSKPHISIPAGTVSFAPAVDPGEEAPSWNNEIEAFKIDN